MGIQTIIFLAALPDQPHLARIGHHHFMPQFAEQATDPGRMRPDFQCDPTAWQRAEDFLQRSYRRSHSLLELYLTRFIQHAVPTVAISQIQSDGQFLLRNIPALRCRYGANLLHCRSPFYLCLEHVDNLGAHPVGDRPSHPIWFRQLRPIGVPRETRTRRSPTATSNPSMNPPTALGHT